MQHALLQQIVGALKRVKVAANSFEVTASSRRAVHAPAAKKEKPRVTRAKSLLEGNDRALEEAFQKSKPLKSMLQQTQRCRINWLQGKHSCVTSCVKP